MFRGYTKLFIKDFDNVQNPEVRRRYGTLAGTTGVVLNLFLSTAKIVVGLLTGAISVLSDGINNLSDAGSSIITLFGFKLSAKKADKEHPYGHGRMEYFAGLAVSAVILVVAVQLLLDSIEKIAAGSSPDLSDPTVHRITLIILGVSILLKLWMALFYRYAGGRIQSVAMKASSLDSICDCFATSVVLACTLLSAVFPGVPVDGIAGVIVSLFIAFTGLKSIKEIVDLLLGQAPAPQLVEEIEAYVTGFSPDVVGVHDLMMHDYGPGRKILILHVEVPAEGDMMQLHDMIDNIERGLEEKFNCITTIHMDPVQTQSARANELKALCCGIVKGIDVRFDLHDFRMNEGDTHANLIFDVVVPFDTKKTKEEIKEEINRKVKEYDPKLSAVVKVEHSYV